MNTFSLKCRATLASMCSCPIFWHSNVILHLDSTSINRIIWSRLYCYQSIRDTKRYLFWKFRVIRTTKRGINVKRINLLRTLDQIRDTRTQSKFMQPCWFSSDISSVKGNLWVSSGQLQQNPIESIDSIYMHDPGQWFASNSVTNKFGSSIVRLASGSGRSHFRRCSYRSRLDLGDFKDKTSFLVVSVQ